MGGERGLAEEDVDSSCVQMDLEDTERGPMVSSHHVRPTDSDIGCTPVRSDESGNFLRSRATRQAHTYIREQEDKYSDIQSTTTIIQKERWSTERCQTDSRQTP